MEFFSGENINIDPNIYVLPCLQELKSQQKMIGRLIGLEYEQQPSKWNGKIVSPLFSGSLYGTANASDYFDRYWSGNDTNIPPVVTKDGVLTIPDFSNYGFTSECKKTTCSEKWSMYTQFLCNQFNQLGVKDNNIALLVTHHNRMRSTDVNQGLLPFKTKKIETEYGEEKSAYANNFCLKITINPGQDPTFEVFFPGFPDKGTFKGDCNSSDTPTTSPNTSFSSESTSEIVGQYLSGGGSGYYYECNTNNINTDLVKNGIIDGLTKNPFDKNMTIYVIRHGNALHNKPVNTSDMFTTDQKRLDSSLTPLGMYQATILADKFKNENAFANSNIILCASFLQRTQLTGLLLLKAAGVLNPQMELGLNIMQSQALTRFKNIGFDINKFNKYPPADIDFNNFEKYYNDLVSIKGGKKIRKTQKRRYTKKHTKKSKYQKKNRTKRRTRR